MNLTPPPSQNSHAVRWHCTAESKRRDRLLLLLSQHGPIMVGPWLSCLCASGRRVPWSQSSDLPRPWHAGSSLHQSSLPGSIHHTHRHCHGVIELAAPAAVASVPYPTIIYFPYVNAQRLRPSGVLSCWPDGPELSSGFYPGIQRAAQTVLSVYLKRICSCNTSASSTLGVLNDRALYKSTH